MDVVAKEMMKRWTWWPQAWLGNNFVLLLYGRLIPFVDPGLAMNFGFWMAWMAIWDRRVLCPLLMLTGSIWYDHLFLLRCFSD